MAAGLRIGLLGGDFHPEARKVSRSLADIKAEARATGKGLAELEEQLRKIARTPKLRADAATSAQILAASKRITAALQEEAQAHLRGSRAVQELANKREVLSRLARAGLTAESTYGKQFAAQIRQHQELRAQIQRTTAAQEAARQKLSSLGSSFANLRNLIAAVGLAAFARELVQAVVQIERTFNTLRAATGSVTAAGREFLFVRGEAKRLGLDLQGAALEYARLAVAARGTALDGEPVRKIFSAVSEAMTVMGASSEQSARALLALNQMISKGTIGAEELRQQLGDALPGAVQLLARALDVSVPKLQGMLEAGEVLSTVALPKLADELVKTFGPALAGALDSAQANINRFKTDVFELKVVAGQGFLEGFLEGVSDLRRALTDTELRRAAVELGKSLGEAFRAAASAAAFLAEHIYGIKAALVAYIALNATVNLISLAQALRTAALAGDLAKTSILGLNAAVLASPWGAAAAAIALLAGALVRYTDRVRASHAAMLDEVAVQQRAAGFVATLREKTDELTRAEWKRLEVLQASKNLSPEAANELDKLRGKVEALTVAEQQLAAAMMQALHAQRAQLAARVALAEEEARKRSVGRQVAGGGQYTGGIVDPSRLASDVAADQSVRDAKGALGQIEQAIMEARTELMRLGTLGVQDTAKLGGEVDKLKDKFAKLREKAEAAVRDIIEELRRAAISAQSANADALLGPEAIHAGETAALILDKIREAQDRLNQSKETARRLSPEEIGAIARYTLEARAATLETKRRTDAQSELNSAIKEGVGTPEDLERKARIFAEFATQAERQAAAQQRAKEFLDAGEITLSQYTEYIRGIGAEFDASVSPAVERFYDRLNEAFDVGRQFAHDIGSLLTDAFAQALETGKVSFESLWSDFKRLAAQAIADFLRRWIAAMVAARAASAALGSSTGTSGVGPVASGQQYAGLLTGGGGGGAFGGAGVSGLYGGSAYGGGTAGAFAAVGAVAAIFAVVYFVVRNFIKTSGTVFASATIALSEGRAVVNNVQGNYRRLQEMQANATAAATFINDLIRALGGTIESLAAVTIGRTGQGKKADHWVRYASGIVEHFGRDSQAAYEFAIVQALKNAEYRGLDPIVEAAIQNTAARNIEQFQADLALAQRVASINTPQNIQALQAGILELQQLRDGIVRLLQGTDQLAAALGNLNAAEVQLFLSSRDAITGRQRTAKEELDLRQAQARLWNAELALRKADIALAIIDVRAKIAAYRGSVLLINGGGPGGGGRRGGGGGIVGVGQAFLYLAGAATAATAIITDAGDAVLQGLNDQLQGLLDLQRELDRIQPIDPSEIRLPRGGGGGVDDRQAVEDLLRQHDLSKLSAYGQQLAEINARYDEGIRQAHGSTEAIERLNRARQEEIDLATRLARATARNAVRDFINVPGSGLFGGALGAEIIGVQEQAAGLIANLRQLRNEGALSREEFRSWINAVREAAAVRQASILTTAANTLMLDLYQLLGDEESAARLRYEITLAELELRREELRVAAQLAGISVKTALAIIDDLLGKVRERGPDLFAQGGGRKTPQELAAENIARRQEEAAQELARAAQQWQESTQRLIEAQNRLRLGDLSGLSAQGQLSEARRQLDATIAAARGGDLDARGSFPAAVEAYLQELKAFSPSSQLYAAEFQNLDAIFTELIGQRFRFGNVTATGQFGSSPPLTSAAAAAQTASNTKNVADELKKLREEGDKNVIAELKKLREEGILSLGKEEVRHNRFIEGEVRQLRETVEQQQGEMAKLAKANEMLAEQIRALLEKVA